MPVELSNLFEVASSGERKIKDAGQLTNGRLVVVCNREGGREIVQVVQEPGKKNEGNGSVRVRRPFIMHENRDISKIWYETQLDLGSFEGLSGNDPGNTDRVSGWLETPSRLDSLHWHIKILGIYNRNPA